MPTIALNRNTADLSVAGDQFTEVEGREEIAQHLWIRLNLHLGEVVYDTNLGVPYIDEVTRKGTTDDRIAQIFRDTILGTPGVKSILSGPELSQNDATGVLTVTFRASTDVGELRFSGPIAVQPQQEVE